MRQSQRFSLGEVAFRRVFQSCAIYVVWNRWPGTCQRGDVARGQLGEREGVLAGEQLLPRLDSFLPARR